MTTRFHLCEENYTPVPLFLVHASANESVIEDPSMDPNVHLYIILSSVPRTLLIFLLSQNQEWHSCDARLNFILKVETNDNVFFYFLSLLFWSSK